MQIKDYALTLNTRGFCHVVDISSQVQQKVDESGLWKGNATVFAVGATAGISTVEYEPGLVQDLEELFNRLVPPTLDYHHEATWQDGNGFSHMRASLLGPSLSVPFKDGRLLLGTWQQIVFLDFDNRSRARSLVLQYMGE